MGKDLFVPVLGYLTDYEARRIRESIKYKRKVSHRAFTMREWAYMARRITLGSPNPVEVMHAYAQTSGRGPFPGPVTNW